MAKAVRVLLAEDESGFRQIVKFWLESKDYEVIEAEDGKGAIQKVRDEIPDLVFLDLHMPAMDGIEALKEIRGFNKEVPVMIISAYLDDERAQEATSYGVSGIFSKDEDFEKWQILLDAALRTHKKLRK